MGFNNDEETDEQETSSTEDKYNTCDICGGIQADKDLTVCDSCGNMACNGCLEEGTCVSCRDESESEDPPEMEQVYDKLKKYVKEVGVVYRENSWPEPYSQEDERHEVPDPIAFLIMAKYLAIGPVMINYSEDDTEITLQFFNKEGWVYQCNINSDNDLVELSKDFEKQLV